ncbi:hypothetical protein [Chryseobacterium sp. FH1]|uniref:hypothetical protein n=1 Tax=Chryseobacterium sp. FH1 TaxID=1233951 RepID=UPI0004E35265|nr:hypothetical protein [Chryseobacterium sp. FH1]KFC19526.1 hypothetical protein IO90_09560 [Chryseobacterium sp. FH1]
MKKIVLITVLILIFSCDKNKTSVIQQIAELPKELKEISGIAHSNNLIYSIEDSGNENQVVVFDTSGTITNQIIVNNTENTDWEDVTFDTKGNLYIGDFGNNDNVRKDLAIYKIDKSNLQGEKADVAYKISFDYPEQTDFPPTKKNLKYDVEAFLEYNNHFYLFTKNRSKDFDGTSYIYKIPNTPGHHRAELVKTITTCNDYQNCAITSAAISPDGSKFVLLSHSKIWLFENYAPDNIYAGKMSELELNHFSQKEAVCFKNNDTLLIADERVKKTGGYLYQMSLKSLKK